MTSPLSTPAWLDRALAPSAAWSGSFQIRTTPPSALTGGLRPPQPCPDHSARATPPSAWSGVDVRSAPASRAPQPGALRGSARASRPAPSAERAHRWPSPSAALSGPLGPRNAAERVATRGSFGPFPLRACSGLAASAVRPGPLGPRPPPSAPTGGLRPPQPCPDHSARATPPSAWSGVGVRSAPASRAPRPGALRGSARASRPAPSAERAHRWPSPSAALSGPLGPRNAAERAAPRGSFGPLPLRARPGLAPSAVRPGPLGPRHPPGALTGGLRPPQPCPDRLARATLPSAWSGVSWPLRLRARPSLAPSAVRPGPLGPRPPPSALTGGLRPPQPCPVRPPRWFAPARRTRKRRFHPRSPARPFRPAPACRDRNVPGALPCTV